MENPTISSPIDTAQVTDDPPSDQCLKKKGMFTLSSQAAKPVRWRRRTHRSDELHQLVFKENGLPDGTPLTYRIKGKILLAGYKHGNSIVCSCHKTQFRPSEFEVHAGMKTRRRPYQHIYTSDGTTLHELSVKLQSGLKSSAACNGDRELVSCGDGIKQQSGLEMNAARNGDGKLVFPFEEAKLQGGLEMSAALHGEEEAATGSGIKSSTSFMSTRPRLRRTLQPPGKFYCTICKSAKTSLNTVTPDTIVYCTQCERHYHICCLKSCKTEKLSKKDMWQIISDYAQWNLFCCSDCRSLSYSLEKLQKSGESAFAAAASSSLKEQIGEASSACCQLLPKKLKQANWQLTQAVKFFDGAFEVTPEGPKDLIKKMVLSENDLHGPLDFRGMRCAAITVKSSIVSAALFRVFDRSIAEIVLVSTQEEWQRKGCFRSLLSLLEKQLGYLHVALLVAPVDDSMQSFWIEKFAFANPSEQQQQVLRTYPIVRFVNTSILVKAISPLQ